MDYMGTLKYLSNIEHKFFHSVVESRFVQNNNITNKMRWYKYNNTTQPKKTSCAKKVIYHNKLHEIFFKLIDPLLGTDEMTIKLNMLMNTHKDLLKTITPHHKKLTATINAYITSTDECDMSYVNEKYMLFWSNLLNANLYIIKGKSYTTYKPNTTTCKEIIIKVHNENFEYVNMSFNEFRTSNKPLFPSVDVSKLNTYTIAELKNICINCEIKLDPKVKKTEIIQIVREVLI